MFGSAVFDVAFGLTALFLMLSLFSSAINELIASLLRSRARVLEKGLLNLLQDPRLAQALYHHDLIEAFHGLEDLPNLPQAKETDAAQAKLLAAATFGKFFNRFKLPSYLPAPAVAQALQQLLVAHLGEAGDVTLQQLRTKVAGLTDASPFFNIKDALLAMMDEARGDTAIFRKNIETWFNQGMERVSGWYKRLTQLRVWCIAFGAAVILNANTLEVAQYLSRDQTVRNTLVATAGKYANQPDFSASVSSIKNDLDNLGLPLGWIDDKGGWKIPTGCFSWSSAILGWLLTAIAISLGAPFWFDVLSKVSVVRSAIKPTKGDS